MKEQEYLFSDENVPYGNYEEKVRPHSQFFKWRKMLLPIISCICVVLIFIIMQQQSIIQENSNVAQYDHSWTYLGFAVFITFVVIANVLMWRKK